MTETDAAVDRSVLVPGAHRLIRTVDRDEGPFAGALVGYEDGVAVCVDAADLAGWGGWSHSDGEHVCGVLDLRRRPDGHDALLPWCTERVETFVGRRRTADAPLAPGELGTLVASLLRGIRELGTDAAQAEGDWWLTGDGRPLFVHGDGGGARARTAALVERISGHTNDRATGRVLTEIISALREHRHHDDEDARWEEQLFAIAAPRALRLDVFAPEKAADLATRRSTRLDLGTAQRTRGHAGRDRGERADRVGGRLRVRAALDGLIECSRALSARVRERPWPAARAEARKKPRDGAQKKERVSIRPRRRPLIIAGSLAVAVLAVGLLWPEGQEDEPAVAAQTENAPPTAEPAETPDPTGSAAPEPTESPAEAADDPVAADDALTATPVLLDTVAACVEMADATCAEALAAGVALPTDGLIVQGAGGSTAALIDDYGDVAVVKLVPGESGEGAAEQMIVLERREKKWLVRDVYDVAHQPNGL
ncbi:hypothetical protein [Microbacterium sp.]|uniref:hypothetical protein n=1 Tax=Microbacterium sp. TaxID=51671 RepID=UPI003F966230